MTQFQDRAEVQASIYRKATTLWMTNRGPAGEQAGSPLVTRPDDLGDHQAAIPQESAQGGRTSVPLHPDDESHRDPVTGQLMNRKMMVNPPVKDAAFYERLLRILRNQ